MINEIVSIIIPIYNVEKYIERCVHSLIKQTYFNIEIILIDDGSKDKSGRICDELKKKDKRIKVIHQNNEGVSRARNKGIKQSKGKYITFVDSDDWVLPNFIELLVNTLIANNSQLAMVDHYEVENNIRKTYSPNSGEVINYKSHEALDNIWENNLYRGYVWNKLFIKDIIVNNNIYFNDEIKLWEDLLFNCQYIEKISKVSYNRTCVYMYEQRENSALNLMRKGKKEPSRINAVREIYQSSKKYGMKSLYYLKSKKLYQDILISAWYDKNSNTNRDEVINEIKGNYNNLTKKHKIMYIAIKYTPYIALVLKGKKG